MVTEPFEVPYSHYLFDAKLSQEIDQRTIQEIGINGFTLMEIAGSSAAKILLERHQLNHGVYLCGKGNNAGDALVVARYLLQHNIDATIIFLSGIDDLSPDTQKNLSLLQKFDSGDKLNIFENWSDFNPPEEFNFIIDGMLGTGLTNDVRGDYSQAVKWANNQQYPIFAMDIPTGLHADSGETLGVSIEAFTTFSFGGRKVGFYLNDGPTNTGSIFNCELPFPNKFKDQCNTYLLDESWLSISSPKPGKHKYASGVLYIIAGSEGLTGAAIMAAKSAWVEGLGAVILICPRGTLSIYEQTLPSIIKKPVGNRDDYFFKEDHAEETTEILSQKEGALLLGPGIGRDPSTVKFVNKTLRHNSYSTVIDADGLWCLAQLEEYPTQKEDWILTPHPGELANLVDSSTQEIENRLAVVREYAQINNVTVMSKGMPGIVGTPDGKCYLTNYDTKYFARAGSGDVLAGKISAYLALKNNPIESCNMGLLNGKKKLDAFLEDSTTFPEPNDFI